MCENAASRLQREAYEIQIGGRSKPLKQFNPCAKGLVYTAEIGNGNTRQQILVTQEATITFCNCHKNLTERDLIDYETPKQEKRP